ncbi:uncharacterized protein si:dkey-52l18.4 [Paralichthys olivaceus]|uniref:Cell adhesion molecule 3 isoform 1 n=1 Tax=Paralichthys olivaceus TaxID=8255 RepID=D2K281_PAROL|nr:PREDICTED: uncharacterized protein LOC109634640 [Paralichthys olivaceus]XP_019950868.1 PREDICTED: uncharacterized protein LOC109634640 [Paralichthys olivaceus]XP_019950869.1 PREDICTED: uncharacterized protein LOC109634640 [Paralichthys olivaceus]ACZ58353.1 cell adhesion molecule 3 isoform 1 [Paralichthys olivaceus]
MSDIHGYLLCAISCLCFLPAGLRAEECNQAVLARRGKLDTPEGGNLLLSCVIQHCGDPWTGIWIWKNVTDEKFSTIKNSDRRHVTNERISVNQTRLVLNFLTVRQSDEGTYGCKGTWGQGDTDLGHLIYVSITAAVPSQRIWFHRILVWAGASLCILIILGLARHLSSRVEPQPLPRPLSAHVAVYRDRPHPPLLQKHGSHSHSAPYSSQQKDEVVYADISKEVLGQQRATREPTLEPTVYSSVKFF